MKTDLRTTGRTSMAASVAPEDLQRGDYVAVLHEIVDFPSFFWQDSMPNQRDELVRIRCVPATGGTPLKVRAICLPFVFVKFPCGKHRTVDIRRVQLVRLEPRYAETVSKEIRGRRSKRKHKKRRK